MDGDGASDGSSYINISLLTTARECARAVEELEERLADFEDRLPPALPSPSRSGGSVRARWPAPLEPAPSPLAACPLSAHA